MPEPFAETLFHTLDTAMPTWKLGVEGVWNQDRLVADAFAQCPERPALLPIARGLLFWAWQQRPLDPGLLGLLLTAEQSLRYLRPEAAAFCRSLGKFLIRDAPFPDQLPETADPDALLVHLRQRAAAAPPGLDWLGFGFQSLLDRGAFAQTRTLLKDFAGSTALAPLLLRLEAECALLAGDPDLAAACLDALSPAIFGEWRLFAQARLALLRGETAEGVSRYGSLWRRMPWHVNLGLVLADLLRAPSADLSLSLDVDLAVAGTRILLYTWNKSADLERTLDSLSRSALGRAGVTVLDNGSTDATPRVLEEARAKDRAWPGGIEIVTLPVNVGAPAARNWLLSLASTKAATRVVFLDDDLILPPDWLTELIGASLRHPKAGTVGCRVVGHAPPHALQAADFHILRPSWVTPEPPANASPTPAADRARALPPDHIHVFNNCLGLRDLGLFDYSRPCASVTGCCHLLTRESLMAVGGFDIRFNPSQFDDLERDLRSLSHGSPCLYHGRAAVRHVQYSSWDQADSPARKGHIEGNKIKLESLFTESEADALAQRNLAMVGEDLREKMVFLEGAVGE